MQNSCIHIYQGNGKGKTTAALGLLLRAVGAGFCVGFASFLKDGCSSEIDVLRDMEGVTVFPFLPKVPFTFRMTPKERQEASDFYTRLLRDISDNLPTFDLIILDEVLDAVQNEIISEQSLLSFLKKRPETTEIVLTGRSAPLSVMALADYITDMSALRHPFEKGIPARLGIEY